MISTKKTRVIGNDFGNSKQCVIIGNKGKGEMFIVPSVNAKVDKSPWTADQDPEQFVHSLYKQLCVTIDSPSVKNGTYLIGEYALISGRRVNNLDVESHKRKCDVDLPVINTLAMIAAEAVVSHYMKHKVLPDEVEVVADQAIGMPASDFLDDDQNYSDVAALKYADNFMKGQHNVTVECGPKRILVKIKFEFVKAIPEGGAVTFAFQKNIDGSVRSGKMFEEFINMYNLPPDTNGTFFKDKRVLHTDIGDGTTEHVCTHGDQLIRTSLFGSKNGVGQAIESALPEFNRAIRLPNSPRQHFSDILKDRSHKHHEKALRILEPHLEDQCSEITRNVRRQFIKLNNDVDVAAVYGGGSIASRDLFYEQIKDECDGREVMMFYVPAEFAVSLNGEGLWNFVNSDIFKQIKEWAKGLIKQG